MLDINSIGCPVCRPKMRKKLMDYFQPYLMTLCEDCNRRFVKNPLRLLDCKQERCQKVISGSPPLVDLLCLTCKNHFKSVLENLDNLQINYNLNSQLVRGLDYYTRTVFEFYDKDDKTRQNTFIGGGRYDDLIKSYGGPSTPAMGFAGGAERIIKKIKDKEIEIPDNSKVDVCILQIGEKARKISLPFVALLEDKGFSANCILGKESLKSQLRVASKMGAKICLIIGQREVLDQTVILRDMEEGSQETVEQNKVEEYLKKKLKKK